jgi:hypothetical protein
MKIDLQKLKQLQPNQEQGINLPDGTYLEFYLVDNFFYIDHRNNLNAAANDSLVIKLKKDK